MTARRYFCGLDLDIAGEKITASIGIAPWKLLAGPATFSDSLDGHQDLVTWLHSYHCLPNDTVFCIEATGHYAEPLTYFLAAQGYSVAIEPLVKVRRTFPHSQEAQAYEPGSQHIAKYAYRFLNELHLWNPSSETLEQVKQLLNHCDLPGSEKGELKSPRQVRRNIRTIDVQIRQLLKPQPTIAHDWPCY